LGYLAQYAEGQLKTNYTFACIVVLSFLGVALFYLMVYLESAAIRLRPTKAS
jgi:ABC-type nitrate/sulfonate/bicarbonate transport system permease component